MDKPTMHMLSVQERGGETRKVNQFVAAVAAAIGAVIAGTILAWTSPALPQLQPLMVKNPITNVTEDASVQFEIRNGTNYTVLYNSLNQTAEFLLDTKDSGLVSSILAIGAAIAALPVGVLAQKIGRRPTILILSIPFMLNWLLIIFANGAGMLIAARFFAGLGTGGICVAAPMYIGEIAETSIRGALGAFFQLFLTVGILFTFVVGGWTHWRTLSIISAVFPPLLVIVFWWMPETPQYLLGMNRRRDAEKVLRWLRGPNAELSGELEDMQKEVDDAARQSASIATMLKNRATLMAFICSLGLMFFQQFSGINAVIFYTNNIFQSAGSNIHPTIATIIVGVVQTIATVLSSLLIERAGRKLLLLQSCIIMGINLIILGIYFKLQEAKYNVSSVGWIPLVCLILFIISFSLGFGPIPWMMMAELFPVEYRGTASGITVIMNWCLVFIVTLCFPIMKEAIGIYSCFWFFAGFMVVCTFFVLFLIPETKGKTVAQIQAILAGRR
ncbi:facilitated trehalose transporter Tret1-2 homolog [Hyposmocoma kahamanoa]|uniref:facilitated trehalose transporter Tret1-2 homolog n=1 Tax=Hyposmocoma kahamanoa TaxID=1477025 RepID=UPI000E6D768F|nr:facilitated trehalose transporter Tret1-2 homolog [Hyposmocoma kahamanoa]XP_026322839.1 facilitated trehalose transporter Tret1-2 homolog [Hyposmocoma kahamanoa]XP_026322840.1 facilitated trehalose transporter Tret1-2 homolog [Hyposmocoma kahamanoa]